MLITLWITYLVCSQSTKKKKQQQSPQRPKLVLSNNNNNSMRQTTNNTNEKMDPLMRIQEEIKEVKRREQEYRQLKAGGGVAADYADLYEDHNGNNALNKQDSNNNNSTNALLNGNSITVNTLNVPDDSSLASSVNSKESLDGHHSDDSGISASSSPINGSSANKRIKPHTAPITKDNGRYMGPNTYNFTPTPPPQKILTRTVSTPQIYVQSRVMAQRPAQKGLMQRFIASRGKLVLNQNSNKPGFGLNGTPMMATPPNTPITPALNVMSYLPPDFSVRNPANIERDAEGRPVRKGYVPVELKIQRELKDYKSRESELKKYRKLRESTPDLLGSMNIENIESDEDDSEGEHCYGPGKLRSTKSISELCDSAQSNNSISPCTTPSPDFEHKMHMHRNGGGGGMRPAVSLAQLCDLDPEEAPSSHRLIAQWESIIKKNEPKSERE